MFVRNALIKIEGGWKAMIDIRTHLDKFKDSTVDSDSFLLTRTLEECDYCRRPGQAVSIIEDDSVCEDCIDKLRALTNVPHSAINSRPLYTPQHSDTNNDLAKVRLYTLNMIDLMSQDIQDIQEDDKTHMLIMQYKHTINRLPPDYNVLYTATRKLYAIAENNYLHISIIIAVRAVISVSLEEGIISGYHAESMYEQLDELYNSNYRD